MARHQRLARRFGQTALISLTLFAVAFTVRLLHIEERQTWPDFARPTMDSKIHDDWAWGLASGDWGPRIAEVQRGPFFRAPLYPYFLAGVYRIFGHDYYIARVIQAIIGSLSVVLLYLISRRLFGNPAGLIAGLLYIFYWPIAYFDGELLIPVVIVFLNLLVILFLLAGVSSRLITVWVLAGAALGLSALGRPNILLVVLFFAVWIWRVEALKIRRKRVYLGPIVFIMAAAVTILPVTMRNISVGGDRVLIAWQGGINFYIGNNLNANGAAAIGPGMRTDWWGGYQDARSLAEADLGRPLKPSVISNYWYRKGVDFLREHPTRAARLYLRKIALFFGNGEVSNNRQLYFVRGQSRVLRSLPINFSFIFGFAVLGIVLLFRRRAPSGAQQVCKLSRSLPLYFIVPYTISVLLFFVTSRYRIPVSITLIPYAAWGMYKVMAVIRAQKWRKLALHGAILIPFFVITSWNPLNVGAMSEPRGLYALGVDYADAQPDKAVEALSQSLALDPTYAPAWKVRGLAHHRIGRVDQAVSDLRVATRLDSTFVEAFFGLGFVLHRSARYEAAIVPYQRTLELKPDHAAAMTNLADIFLRTRRHNEAGALLNRALALNPSSEPARFGLAEYHERIGDTDRAIELYEQLIHYPSARLKLVAVYLTMGRFDNAAAAIQTFEIRFGASGETEALRKLVTHYTDSIPRQSR